MCCVLIRSELFGTLIRQPVEFFDTAEVGVLTSRIGADCQAVVRCLSTNLNVALRNGLQCIGEPCNLVLLFFCHMQLPGQPLIRPKLEIVESCCTKPTGQCTIAQQSTASDLLWQSWPARQEKSLHASSSAHVDCKPVQPTMLVLHK
jgi:hypothetical protein